MALIISIIVNIILLITIFSIYGKSKEVVENTVYVPEIRYRDRITYQDRIVYQDKVVEKVVYRDKVVVNNKIKTTTKKPKTTVVVKETPIKKVPKTKREEILGELAMLKAKKKKTKQDMDNIYTLEMILPNVK